MTNLVVARYTDGRTIKGRSLDVAQNRPTCHVRTQEGAMVDVALKDLKALFFVKSLDGNSTRNDGAGIGKDDPRLRGASLVEVSFRDAEKIVGLCLRYPPTQPYFFMVPVDAGSNNLRILINRAEVGELKLLNLA